MAFASVRAGDKVYLLVRRAATEAESDIHKSLQMNNLMASCQRVRGLLLQGGTGAFDHGPAGPSTGNPDMNFKNTLQATVLAIASMAGCAQSTDPMIDPSAIISSRDGMDAIDLDAPDGGLSHEDEAPAFGDALLLAEAMREDELASTASADSSFDVADGDLRRVWVRILWGRLGGWPEGDPLRDPGAHERVDWTGGVAVDRGVVLLRRTILFERPFDHPVPRESRQRLGWVSHTGPHLDGVLLCIGLPADSSDAPAAGHMTFATGPLTIDIPLADLYGGIARVIESSERGNAVSFVSSTQRPEACAHGFLAGYWQRVLGDEHEGGFLRGRVLDAEGRLVGYLGGRFGVNSEGKQIFFGKLIARDGQVRGLVRGMYRLDENGHGGFRGHWASRDGTLLGELHGMIRTGPEGAGFLHGVWAARCGG